MENRFFYDAKERIFTISEVDTLVWILKEVEQRLRADNIFPVDYQETEKWTVFGNRRIVTSGVRKVSLCGNETIRNLREAAEAYAAGYGRPDISTVIVNKFAYFIKEETKERK